jgi:hypothetical protein
MRTTGAMPHPESRLPHVYGTGSSDPGAGLPGTKGSGSATGNDGSPLPDKRVETPALRYQLSHGDHTARSE